jgi:hypothetical protein
MNKGGKVNDKLSVMVKQYERLQDYANSVVPRIRNNIFSFGIGSISAIFTGNMILFTELRNEVLSGLIFIIILPLFCLLVLLMWLGEIHRMKRVGNFLRGLAKKINEELEEKVLTWEEHIRESSHKIEYPEFWGMFLFLGASFIFPLIGVYVINGMVCTNSIVWAIIPDFCIHSIIVLMIWTKIIKKLK